MRYLDVCVYALIIWVPSFDRWGPVMFLWILRILPKRKKIGSKRSCKRREKNHILCTYNPYVLQSTLYFCWYARLIQVRLLVLRYGLGSAYFWTINTSLCTKNSLPQCKNTAHFVSDPKMLYVKMEITVNQQPKSFAYIVYWWKDRRSCNRPLTVHKNQLLLFDGVVEFSTWCSCSIHSL